VYVPAVETVQQAEKLLPVVNSICQVLERDIQEHPGSGACLYIRIVVVESVLKYQPTSNRNLPQ
jgi:hypothetical protein